MINLGRFIAQRATLASVTGSHHLRTTTSTATELVPDANEKSAKKQNMDEPIDITNPFEKDPQQCILCKHNITPYYKNVKLLSQFQSPYTGRIYGRHITGLCKTRQEEVEGAILRAQHCLLMPGYHKDLEFLEDPKLFDPERPVRPHKY